MKKCANCGYVRRPEDDEYAMVPSKACPKCYAFYPTGETNQPLPDTQVKEEIKVEARPPSPGMSKGMWIAILAVAVAVSFAAAYYLAGRTAQDKSSPSAPQATFKFLTGEDGPGSLPQKELTLSELVKKISPSVVSVINYNEKGEAVSRGTGFFAGGSGEVITNRHVLTSPSVEIRTAQGRTVRVTGIISEDEQNDLVVLATGMPASEAVPLRISSFRPERGEKVIVIGGPLGYEQSVSDGIVSASRELNGRKVLQITAPISPGSSGSPVVNLKGEVIGVATMHNIKGQNLNFCVPAEVILGLRPTGVRPLGNITPYSPSRQVYVYQDENKKVHFSRERENPRYNYILLTKPDGSIDRDRFDSWFFEQAGSNPYKIDPQALVNAEKERLPELFRQVFPGHEMDELRRFPPESRAFWGTYVANHMQEVYNRAQREKTVGIAAHKQLLAILEAEQRR